MGYERKHIDDDPNGGQDMPLSAIVFLMAIILIVGTAVAIFG